MFVMNCWSVIKYTTCLMNSITLPRYTGGDRYYVTLVSCNQLLYNHLNTSNEIHRQWNKSINEFKFYTYRTYKYIYHDTI